MTFLYRTATEGEMTSTLKHVKPGDAIMSLLSFLDHLARYTCLTTKSTITELQQKQALQNCECQSNGGYQGYQTALWCLQGLSKANKSAVFFSILDQIYVL